jgi:hypothetical protein
MNNPEKSWRNTFQNALVSGTVASVASTISLSLLGKAELDRSAAPMNGPSQWIWGRHAPYQNRFSLRYTIVGYLIHHAASVFWAVWYERLHRRRLHRHFPAAENSSRVLAAAVATAAAAYTVDFHVTPQRLTPGFEHRLSKRSLLTVYGTFALGLAATALLRRYSGSAGMRNRKKK